MLSGNTFQVKTLGCHQGLEAPILTTKGVTFLFFFPVFSNFKVKVFSRSFWSVGLRLAWLGKIERLRVLLR